MESWTAYYVFARIKISQDYKLGCKDISPLGILRRRALESQIERRLLENEGIGGNWREKRGEVRACIDGLEDIMLAQ